MTTRKPVPIGPDGDGDARPADNDLSAVTIRARVRMRNRVGILAGADTYHLPSSVLDPTVLHTSLFVEVELSIGGLEIVADDPETAEDLAAALTWAASRLRELRAGGGPAKDRRTFGLAKSPPPARRADGTPTTTTATKEAA